MQPSRYCFTWDIDYRCRYRCTYCFLNFEPETTAVQARDLPPERWIQIWEDIHARYGSCHIEVTGGEPFDYPGFLEIIDRLQSLHTFQITTNLSFDADEFAARTRPDRVQLASSFHPDHVGLEEFVAKLRVLNKRGYRPSVTVVAHPPLLGSLPAVRKRLARESTGLIVFPFRGVYQGRKYPESYNAEEKTALRELGHAPQDPWPNKDLYGTWVEKDRKPPESVCRMGQVYGKILPNGDVSRCCAAARKDWGRLGNIIDGTFAFKPEPEVCAAREKYCVCFRSMVLGEEDRWARHWPGPPSLLQTPV